MPPDMVRCPHTGGWRRTAALQEATGQVGAAPGAGGETEAVLRAHLPAAQGQRARGPAETVRSSAPRPRWHGAVTGSGCPERRRRQSPVRMRAAGLTGPRPARAPPSGVPGMAAPSRPRAALARRGRQLLTQKEAVHVEEQVGDGPRGGHGRRHLSRRVRRVGAGRLKVRARPPSRPAASRTRAPERRRARRLPLPPKASLRLRTQGRLLPRAPRRRAHAPSAPSGYAPPAHARSLWAARVCPAHAHPGFLGL